MIGDFLARLVIALPLVSALAVLMLVAARKGWIVLPAGRGWRIKGGWMPLRGGRAGHAPEDAGRVRVLGVHSIAPTARVAVVRFHGTDHLLAVNGQTLLLVASADMAAGLCVDGDSNGHSSGHTTGHSAGRQP